MKHLILLKLERYDRYQRGITSIVSKFFIKSSQVAVSPHLQINQLKMKN